MSLLSSTSYAAAHPPTRAESWLGILRRSPLGLWLVGGLWTTHAQADPSRLEPEYGYNYGDIETPRIAAVGGALRATANSTSAIFVNPANMAASQIYHVSALSQIYPEAARQSYGGAVVDSIVSSTGIAGGLSGVWSSQDPEGIQRETIDFRFGAALPIEDVFYIGLLGRTLSLNQKGTGPLGSSQVSGGIPDSSIVTAFTLDAGATVRPIPEFAIALTGHNLTNPDHAFLPLMGGLGVGVGTKIFSIAADAVIEARTFRETKLRAMLGGEVLLAEAITLRAGYRFDSGLNQHSVSGGAGYIDKKFSVDMAVRRSATGPELTAIMVGFSLHIESLGLGEEDASNY